MAPGSQRRLKRKTNPVIRHHLPCRVRLHRWSLIRARLPVHGCGLAVCLHRPSHPPVCVVEALTAIVDRRTMALDWRPVVRVVASCRWIACETCSRRDRDRLAIRRSGRHRLRILLRPRSHAFPGRGQRQERLQGCLVTYMVRGSLRMRSLTPWSANERERKVDSSIPGKFLGGDTAQVSTDGLSPS